MMSEEETFDEGHRPPWPEGPPGWNALPEATRRDPTWQEVDCDLETYLLLRWNGLPATTRALCKDHPTTVGLFVHSLWCAQYHRTHAQYASDARKKDFILNAVDALRSLIAGTYDPPWIGEAFKKAYDAAVMIERGRYVAEDPPSEDVQHPPH